jgi:alkanesulfonate monooxygenase SsuD/methylene tetrahydromethanopterin reductase-like flavin-dependent oxidoreductase (luciferase family)
VKLGLFLPPFGELADPGRVADLAVAAEEAGWSGFFLWDHVLSRPGVPVADAWITMAAVAAATREIRLGAMVTPLSRRRPWVLAREVATLDRLSGGRLVLGAGLGDDGWKEFSSFGEVTDLRERAALLDDSLEALRRLLAGEEVAFEGKRLAVHSSPLPRPAPLVGARRDRAAAGNGRPLGRLLVLDDVHHRVDEREVGEGLREVAQVPP